jgi:hypothetical protein
VAKAAAVVNILVFEAGMKRVVGRDRDQLAPVLGGDDEAEAGAGPASRSRASTRC